MKFYRTWTPPDPSTRVLTMGDLPYDQDADTSHVLSAVETIGLGGAAGLLAITVSCLQTKVDMSLRVALGAAAVGMPAGIVIVVYTRLLAGSDAAERRPPRLTERGWIMLANLALACLACLTVAVLAVLWHLWPVASLLMLGATAGGIAVIWKVSNRDHAEELREYQTKMSSHQPLTRSDLVSEVSSDET